MKTFILVWATAGCMLAAQAQEIKKENVPAAVRTAFDKEYPQVKEVKWEKEGAAYEAGFKVGQTEHSVLISASGTVLETETEIAPADLPASVRTYVAEHFPGKKIEEAARITDSKNTVTYEVEIDGRDHLFNAQGVHIQTDKK